MRVMFVGDSITAGKGYCFRYHLWKRLQAAGYDAARVDFVGDSRNQPYHGPFDEDHEGYGGATADKVVETAAPGIAQHRPDIAVIHLGTNDFITQKDPAAVMAADVEKVIGRLRAANPKVTVLLAQIPFVSREYREAIAALAARLDSPGSPVRAVDLATGWGMKPGEDTVDYVHPNLNGALKIADRLYAALEPELRRRAITPSALPSAREAGPAETNLAAGKAANAGAPAAPGCGPEKATDGDPLTLWAAGDTKTPRALTVDLGSPAEIAGTGVVWDSAGAPYGYRVEVSLNGASWRTVADRTVKPTEVSVALEAQRDAFSLPERARFVRVTVTSVPNEPWTRYPAGIRELLVLAPTPLLRPAGPTMGR